MRREMITNIVERTLLGTVALLIASCGSSSKPPPTSEPRGETATQEPSEAAPAEVGEHEIPTGGRIQSPKLIDRRARGAIAPDALDTVRSAARAPESSAEVYRAVAPATVIVRVPGGIGSGAIISPRGWILTNHHVIAQGETQDFETKVQVILGKLDRKTGGMVRQNQEHVAYVYKADKLRDLALLKLSSVPKSLPYISIAKQNPVPGQQVIAIGHAGAGMLWAIKAGEISALGKLSEHLSTLAKFKDDEQGKDAAKRFKAYLDGHNLGLVIQSTCNILPGDSGGPLVTRSGELIGINAFSNKDKKTGGRLNFHVHREEVAKFVKVLPKQRARLIPDPWKEGGGDASYEDADLDGRADVLLMKGRRPCGFCPRQSLAVFVDIDQDSFPGKTTLPPLTEVFEKRSFDAEMVFLRLENNAIVWYDTDNDGDYDVLLVDEGTTGRSTHAYRIRANGEIDKWSPLAKGRTVRLSLFQAPELRQRLGRIAIGAFPSDFVEANTAWKGALPDPIGRSGNAKVGDLNYDGTNDAIRVGSAFGERLIIDANQNWVSQLPESFKLSEIGKAGPVDAEVAVVSQGTFMWIWYDTDDDGRFDLVLHSPGSRLYVAKEAWKVDASGGLTMVPEHVGRKLIRPELLGSSKLTEGLRSMVAKRSFLSIMSALEDKGLATFPDPIKDHRGTGYAMLDYKTARNGVVLVQGRGSDGYLVDLDENSLRGRPRSKIDITKTVSAGKFDAEFAYFLRNGLAWAYYDTDNVRGYDLVLYTADPKLGKAHNGFRIDRKGVVTLDPALAGKAMVSHSLFERAALVRRLEKWGKHLFADRLLEH